MIKSSELLQVLIDSLFRNKIRSNFKSIIRSIKEEFIKRRRTMAENNFRADRLEETIHTYGLEFNRKI